MGSMALHELRPGTQTGHLPHLLERSARPHRHPASCLSLVWLLDMLAGGGATTFVQQGLTVQPEEGR